MVRVTVRKSLTWEDGAPSETTDTMVVTSTGKEYVDLRFVRSDLSHHDLKQWISEKDLNIGKVPTNLGLLPPTVKPDSITNVRYEWANSGKVEIDPHSHHVAKFTHDIDNKLDGRPDVGTIGKSVIDQDGDYVEIENGEGLNEQTGSVQNYREIWKPLDFTLQGTIPAYNTVLHLRAPKDGKFERLCGGTIIRAGCYLQAIVALEPGKVSCVRALWGEIQGRWLRVYSIGELAKDIPIESIPGHHRMEKVQQLESSIGIWDVIEDSTE